MSIPRKIGGGGAVLALFVVTLVGVTTVRATPGPGSRTTAAVSKDGDSYLRTLWSTSNQFGNGQSWQTVGPSGSSVTHIAFTGDNRETAAASFSARGFRLLYPTGSIAVEILPHGRLRSRVTVSPGACTDHTADLASAAGGSATILLDKNGHPLASSRSAAYLSLRKALQCKTSAIRSQMASFASVAHLFSYMRPMLMAPYVPAPIVRPDSAEGCAVAVAEAALAAAELDAALLDPELAPLVPALFRAYEIAVAAVAVECANATVGPQ